MYRMDEQLQKGTAGAQVIAKYLSPRFCIEDVSRTEQRQGKDFKLTDRLTGSTKFIEVKSDEKAVLTHNAFIETISVDAVNKPGWAYTCEADEIFYYCLGLEIVYVLNPFNIRALLPVWSSYPLKPAWNEGYKTWGLCVPLEEIEACATEVINL